MKYPHSGSFTIPGESGYEKLTLTLAKTWGADVIRDSDGTKLSPELLETGMDVYSTICVIRNHNAFAKKHPEYQQQTILESQPVVAHLPSLSISLLAGYSKKQFQVNATEESIARWQVFDRTTNEEVDATSWKYNEKTQSVELLDVIPWHSYSVDFFVWRIGSADVFLDFMMV